MKQLSCLYILFLLLGFSSSAQQTVHKKLNQILLEESFNELNDIWPVITNDDNFFVFDKGEYFMNRTKTETPYAIMANWQNDLNSFSLRTSLMLGPAESSYQSLGLIFRASNDGQSALICDINKSHRFRIRQLHNGNYHVITTEGKDGWIKNNVIKGINEYNDINIKTNGSDHDIFINGSLVYSFRIENLEAGSFGILIGPETKGRIDYLNIYADELYRDKSKIYLSDDEIRDLITENDNLKIKLELSLDARALELENAIRILENQLKTMRLVNEQLDNESLIREKYIGIRPAPGYPACPDHLEKKTIWELMNVEEKLGVKLTENLAMWPAASVSGYYFSNKNSKYFGLGKIKEDQLIDYSKRKNISLDDARKWLKPNLL